jgi:hypothetical protein
MAIWRAISGYFWLYARCDLLAKLGENDGIFFADLYLWFNVLSDFVIRDS